MTPVASRSARKTLAVMMIVTAVVWISGSAVALIGVTPSPADRCAFRVWAVAWPIFKVLPEDGRLLFVQWSDAACGW